MKTASKSQLIEIIRKNGPSRPTDLARLLTISPQAVHRHLKALVLEGIIEPRGKPPSTRYMITDIPDFRGALDWFAANTAGSASTLCETRDRFSARLVHFKGIGLSENDLSLVISASGEVGNNSFDHNMGQWRDVPGCWFEIQTTRNRLWVVIADRGQGIYRSISRVVPGISDDESAVKKVFEEHISGRAPEKRGNGLKFVKKLITENPQRGVACRSGSGSIYYGDFGQDCLAILSSLPNQNFGTITLIAWTLK